MKKNDGTYGQIAARGEARPGTSPLWGHPGFFFSRMRRSRREGIRTGFPVEHEKWYQQHLSRRRGERRDALLRDTVSGTGFSWKTSQTIIKYCRQLAAKGKRRPVPSGPSGKVCTHEYPGTDNSPDLL